MTEPKITPSQLKTLVLLSEGSLTYTKRSPSPKWGWIEGRRTVEKLPPGVTVGVLFALRSNGWASPVRKGSQVTWSLTPKGREKLLSINL